MKTIDVPSLGEITILENNYPNREYTIEIDVIEFSCLCPITGQPDFAQIIISYIPLKYLVELKSLKLYLQSYRNIGITHEDITNQIHDYLKKKLKPKQLNITSIFNIRGGIKTSIYVKYNSVL